MKKLLLFGVLIAGVAYFATRCCHKNVQLLTYPETTIWGNSKEDTKITPFTVKIDPKDMDDLKQRLARWRRHEPLEGVGRSYGITYQALDGLVKHWREKYDFGKFESKLNSLPQFTTVIQGLRLHFIHAKADPKATKKVPLLLVHGWPGSVVEFYKAIPQLTSVGPDGMAFDVIAPSLPGFGFSEAASKPGMNPIAIAQVLHGLMKRLGHEKYVYQGGDWGAVIGGVLSRIYPDNVIGYHTNFMVIPSASLCQKLHLAAASIAPKLFLTENEIKKFEKFSFTELLEESGYFHEQGTKPDTIGVALSDSPVGLAAWIAEKFEIITERSELKGHPAGQGISNDDLITNLMVYWLSNHVTSAGRIYKETVQVYFDVNEYIKTPLPVPTGVACYPEEIVCSPKSLLTKHDVPHLVHYADMPHGGHFAAMEEPEAFAKDVRVAVAAFLKAREEEKQQPAKSA